MLAIAVDLLHGTIRAASADDLGLTGRDDPGDWPPSPARLFSALVAAGGTGRNSILGDGTELRILETADPPVIYADDRAEVLASRQEERFVVIDALEKASNVHEYPARKAKLVRPGTRLCPRRPRVVYVWEDLEADAAALSRIEARAHRIGYFGCSDSPVRVTVSSELPAGLSPAQWLPNAAGSALLPVPYRGLLDDLDDAFTRWSEGEPVRRAWNPPELMSYMSPSDVGTDDRSSIVLWLRFGEAVPGRLVRSVTESLKAATLSLYQEYVSGPAGEPPPILHGHGFEGATGFQLAWWIGLPDVGQRNSRGRLHGAAVVLPPGTAPDTVEGVRTALWHLSELRLPGGRIIPVHGYAGERRPWAIVPDRWSRPARWWVSVTPVVHERRRDHGPTREDVESWCAHAGFPAPTAFRCSPVPLLPGGLALQPFDVYHSDGSRRPFCHLELVFDRPVSGPMALGRMRQLGLGLMAPERGDGS